MCIKCAQTHLRASVIFKIFPGLYFTSVVYIDFTKAFDLVPHAKLLQKLESYGIQGYLLKWINSFLSNRIQCTKIGEDLSSWTPIYSGVIQGSCLGPLLFLLYINDITDIAAPAVTMKMYADDVKLYTEISNGEHVIDLQHTLNQIHCWSITWQMPISLTKCSIMNISHSDAEDGANLMLGNTTLQESTELKDLGIMIDKHLKFKNHINYVVKTAYARANSIRRCFVSRHLPSLLQAYKIYVRPVLEYNTQVWSPFSVQQITAIENVQRKFTKCMPGLNKLPYYQRLAKLDLESLEIRRLRADLILAYKIVFGIISTDLAKYLKGSDCNSGNSDFRKFRFYPSPEIPEFFKQKFRKFVTSSFCITCFKLLVLCCWSIVSLV
jgi:ribonuclease P/MRP protein subunit RPP40